MKTLELFEEEVCVLVIKKLETFHNYTHKGTTHVSEIYLVSYNSKELNYKKLHTEEVPKLVKK
jgi:hypothetical protein